MLAKSCQVGDLGVFKGGKSVEILVVGVKEELIAESKLFSKKGPVYHNNRLNPFEIFKNLSNNDYWPNPDFPGGFKSKIGGYRPTSLRTGWATIDFAGGVKVKFPFALPYK